MVWQQLTSSHHLQSIAEVYACTIELLHGASSVCVCVGNFICGLVPCANHISFFSSFRFEYYEWVRSARSHTHQMDRHLVQLSLISFQFTYVFHRITHNTRNINFGFHFAYPNPTSFRTFYILCRGFFFVSFVSSAFAWCRLASIRHSYSLISI